MHMQAEYGMAPRVATAPDGKFVVAWHCYPCTNDTSGDAWFGVYGQRYNAAGTKLGGEFQTVDILSTYHYHWFPDVACDHNGNFVIVYETYSEPDDPILNDYGIFSKQYNSGGGLTVGNWCVNNPGLQHRGIGNQQRPSVTRSSGNGVYTCAWHGLQGVAPSGGVASIWHRQVTGNPAPTISWGLTAPTSGNYNGGTPIVGDWTNSGHVSAGFYSNTPANFFLRNSNSTGTADTICGYGPGSNNWTPLAGDWTHKGYDSFGLYNPATATWFLRNSNTSGVADISFMYGSGGNGWIPITGNWVNSGSDTIGLYDPVNSDFYLRYTNTTGAADATFHYGTGGAGWKPIVGDWNGNGAETIGVYDPATSTFHLRNSNSAGSDDYTFVFGTPGAGWIPLAGDWDGDGTDSIGLYDPVNNVFHLRNSNSAGPDNITYTFGCPIAIRWDTYGAQSGYTVCLCVTPGTDYANARWISIGSIQAINGSSVWSWNRRDTNGDLVPKGTWYIAGYIWNGSAATYNHATSSFVIS
jgi:hypothetical protein